jgi:Domain of unknown function (DUF4401)
MADRQLRRGGIRPDEVGTRVALDMMSADELLDVLPKTPEAAPERPWYIGLLLGVAGWFAGLLLLVFVAAVLRPDSGPGALTLGIVLLAAAWGLFKVDKDGAFVSQLALALSIAGQLALLYGLHESLFKSGRKEIATIAFVALAIQLALVPAMPNRLHRSMSTLFACIAWAIFVRYGLWDQPFWADWGPGKAKAPPTSLPMALAGWVVAWAPAGGALYLLVRREPAWMAAGRQAVARPVATGLMLGLAFATSISHPFETFRLFSDTAAPVGWLALWPLLSAIASLGALAAAFALGNRGLMGLAVLAALLHMAHFYYALGASLLLKSVVMLVMGAACLAGAHYLRKR